MRYVKSLGLMAALMWAVTSPASAQSTNWTGAYVGINAGGSSTGYTSALQGFPGNFVNADHDSVIAGLHGGLQYQFGSFVLGLEASYSSTDGFSGFGDRVAGGTSDCLIQGNTLACQAKLNNLAMIGPRVGWTPMNNWLIYGTGGWAKGKLSDQVVVTATGVVVGATSETHRGTFFGGGIEYAVSSNLILGVEYLRIDLNDKFHCEVPGLGGCNAGESRTASAESDVVRARLSLKLGGDDRRGDVPVSVELQAAGVA